MQTLLFLGDLTQAGQLPGREEQLQSMIMAYLLSADAEAHQMPLGNQRVFRRVGGVCKILFADVLVRAGEVPVPLMVVVRAVGIEGAGV